MPPDELDSDDVARFVLAFAKSIAAGDWIMAQSFLSSGLLGEDHQSVDLQHEYEEMISYWDRPAESVRVVSADPAWASVSIESTAANFGRVRESVSIRIEMEAGRPRITKVIWGRQ